MPTPPTTPALVTADDREQASGVPAHLAALKGVELRIDRLPAGDYLVCDRVAVERKTLADFAISIVDDRLFRQATRLSQSRFEPLFLLEGTGDDLLPSRMSREALQGALVTLTVIFGIPVLRARTPIESARLIAYAARQVHRAGTRLHPGNRRNPKSLHRKRLRILQCFPGLGPQRAELLLETFGSLRACFQADPKSLLQIPGVGPKTARAITKILGSPPLPPRHDAKNPPKPTTDDPNQTPPAQSPRRRTIGVR